MSKDTFDEYITLLRDVRDGIKKAQIAMTIPRPDRAKLIMESLSSKCDRLWELETSNAKNS